MKLGDAARRGFLRGLATLPLVGGAVTILGQPTAAAEPITDALLERYHAWLSHEHREVYVEVELRAAQRHLAEAAGQGWHFVGKGFPERREAHLRQNPAMYWFPDDQAVIASVRAARPSSRAAVVLSAVGCHWRA